MLIVECKGSPYEIGFQHGSAAKVEIERGIAFYAKLFLEFSKQQWSQVRETARTLEKEIQTKWGRYHKEIQGIADGAERDVLDIVALNVRTEIAFGLFSDGCTSLYWNTEERAFLGQNWDWMEEQKGNLILATIHQEGLPTIKMVTEAGMIGKIGLNSSGVGVCFNAIKAKGFDSTRLPVHLGLRMVLESTSAEQAVSTLESMGMASSAHMLIADAHGATGLEFTSSTFARLTSMDSLNRVYHSNHLLAKHPGVYEPKWLADSKVRIQTMRALLASQDVKTGSNPSWGQFSQLFEDQTGFPSSICRSQEGVSGSASLFNIVMDLKANRAVFRLGKPTQVEETIILSFE